MNMTAHIGRVLGSRRFLYAVLVFFALESLWIALSAVYPMAFDEEFHLGVIRIYAQQWLPFLAGQPDNAGQFGALAADPSYLYHYVMSFPYRVLQAVGANEAVTVILLRLINVALAVWAVALFGRVLRRTGMSAAFTHTALALFVLVPAVPLLAGQINYDNAVLLLVAWLCLLAFDIYAGLQRRQVDTQAVCWCVAMCLLASVIKYAVLPLIAGVVVFLVIAAARAFWNKWHDLWSAVQRGWRIVSRNGRVVLVVAVVVGTVLFAQRYVVNTMRYHTPIPACDAVLGVRDCLEYGPWVRNYSLSKARPDNVDTNPFSYTWLWLQALHYRMFFAVNGPSDSYRNYPPLPLPSGTFVVLAVLGVLAVAGYGWRVLRDKPLLICLFGMCALYGVLLWMEDYSQFVETGQPVAINGRYLLPLLLPLAAVCGVALRKPITYFKHAARIKASAAVVVLLLFLHGGGVFTFIARSDAAWYWPNTAVRTANQTAQRLLLPVLYEGHKYYR